MRHLFRHLKKKYGRHSGFGKGHKPCENLADAAEDSIVVITGNHDHRTVERGLYTGVQVKVLRNVQEELNLIVAVGDARYVLDRRIARRIRVASG